MAAGAMKEPLNRRYGRIDERLKRTCDVCGDVAYCVGHLITHADDAVSR